MTNFIKFIDKYIVILIWTSIILLFVELCFNEKDSLQDRVKIFLWIERATAVVFMIEYFFRCAEDYFHPENTKDIVGKNYILSPMGAIDLISWLPFFVGFFVPVQYLGWIRALRILRALKLIRYNRNLQLFTLAIYRSFWLIKAIGYVVLVFALLGSVLIFEAEKELQPDKLGDIFNCFWYTIVTISTVGYGDISPVSPLGKIISAIFIMMPGVATFAAFIGIVGNSWSEIMEMEKDENFDPIHDFVSKTT